MVYHYLMTRSLPFSAEIPNFFQENPILIFKYLFSCTVPFLNAKAVMTNLNVIAADELVKKIIKCYVSVPLP